MHKSRHFLYIALTLLIATYSTHSTATENYSVAMVVEDEIISKLDVEQRLKMALITSGITPSRDIERTLIPQIVQVLIDETLYLKEASRLGIYITEEELNAAIRNIEVQNALPTNSFESFLEQQGLPKKPFINQLRAQIAWSKIIQKKIRPYITVNEKEIEESLEHLSSKKGVEEVYISEIILPIDTAKDEEKVQKLAKELINKARKGNAFSNLASQFSRSPSAPNGGEIGWVELKKLSKEFRNPIKTLNPSDITNPIRLRNAYAIIKLHDRKLTSSIDKKELDKSEVTLKQIFIPLKRSSPEEQIIKEQEKLENAKKQIQQCSSIEEIAKTVQNTAKTDPIKTQIKNFHPEIREIIRDLATNKASPVIQTSLGLHIFMICERKLPESAKDTLPTKDSIYQKLAQRKMMLQARKYLRDLRRSAFIDIKL